MSQITPELNLTMEDSGKDYLNEFSSYYDAILFNKKNFKNLLDLFIVHHHILSLSKCSDQLLFLGGNGSNVTRHKLDNIKSTQNAPKSFCKQLA